MMGRSHGVSGAAAGLGLGAAMNAGPATCGLLAAVSYACAYVPDIDCGSSTVSHSIPILGRPASWALRTLSEAVYAITKGPRDEPWTGGHRHLTHTCIFAVAFGALLGSSAWLLGARLGFAGATHLGWLVGIAAALGCWVHCLGDSLTLMGCPWLWPIPIAGETWAEIRLPRFLRFRTGGAVETRLVFPALCVVTVLLIPGAWPIVTAVLSDLGQLK